MKYLGIAIILIPVSMALTISALPFWSWVEATAGIESLGHSGPASWCYVATYVFCMASTFVLLRIRRRARR